MSNLTPDSANGAAGAAGTPTPTVSAQPSGQPNSSAPIGLDDAQVDQLLAHPKFVERLTRATQSAKDRRFSDLQKQISDMQAGKATPADVRKTLDELEGENPAAVAPGRATAPAQGADSFKQETAAILAKAGIPVDDPELVALAAKPVNSQAEWFISVGQLAARRGVSTATAGSVVVDQGGQSAGARTREDKMSALTAQLAAMKPSDPKYKATTAELEAMVR